MIPVVLVKAVEPVTAAKPLGAGRDYTFRLLPQLDPGDVFSARVEAKLPDGSFKVMLAGQAMSMSLPSRVAPGDTLSLTFVSREPRLTFALKVMPQTASAPAPLLSAAGRLVAATMLQPGEPALPLAASTQTPLLAAPPADGARLSGALAQTLAGSGLFYESHLAQWIAGARTLAQVRREPQARLAQPAPEVRAASTEEPATDTAARSSAPGRTQEQSIDPRTVALVQQQLAALDGSRILLQLEIWPGQWLQWEIDDDPPGPGPEADTPQDWTTQLRLDLPRLGELRASLALNAEGVRIRLDSGSAASAALLRERRADLQACLATAGLPPADIAVAYHEPV